MAENSPWELRYYAIPLREQIVRQFVFCASCSPDEGAHLAAAPPLLPRVAETKEKGGGIKPLPNSSPGDMGDLSARP